jgi:hypothetical protein
MGSVLLNASQKEETLAKRAYRARAEAIHLAPQSRGAGFVELAVADLFRAGKKSRGNSAKALICRRSLGILKQYTFRQRRFIDRRRERGCIPICHRGTI